MSGELPAQLVALEARIAAAERRLEELRLTRTRISRLEDLQTSTQLALERILKGQAQTLELLGRLVERGP